MERTLSSVILLSALATLASACSHDRASRTNLTDASTGGDMTVVTDSGGGGDDMASLPDSMVSTDAIVSVDASPDASTTQELNDCITFCERNNDCDPKSEPNPCAADCARIVTVHTNGGCRSLWNTLYPCAEPLDMTNFCGLDETSCGPAFSGWLSCYVSYCDEHPTTPECAG